LRSESISIGKKEDSSRKERARTALFNTIVNLGLVRVLWSSLSQQRHHFLSEDFSEAHSGGGGLKLLGLLFDGNLECFLKLTEFLSQASSGEKYRQIMPPFREVFAMFEPALAFLAIRHGLPPYGRALNLVTPDVSKDSKDMKELKSQKDSGNAADDANEVGGATKDSIVPESATKDTQGETKSQAEKEEGVQVIHETDTADGAQKDADEALVAIDVETTPVETALEVDGCSSNVGCPHAEIDRHPPWPNDEAVSPAVEKTEDAAEPNGTEDVTAVEEREGEQAPREEVPNDAETPSGGSIVAANGSGRAGDKHKSIMSADHAPVFEVAIPGPEMELHNELDRVVRQHLSKNFESDGISLQFYLTFWTLSLQDIFVPTDGYDKALSQITTNLKQMEVTKKAMERDRDFSHSRDYKALKKEGARLSEIYGKLKDEKMAQNLNHQKVLNRLKQERSGWFLKRSPHATAAFVHEMICPRVLTSYSDALFCSHFVKLLIQLHTPGFQLLDFYNSWTIMLTQTIRCCSEREAQIFGVFLREMMSYVLKLRRDETIYTKEMTGNPCFHRNYYDNPNTEVTWAQYADIKKGHSKWEGRIFKAIRLGLDSEDWMERRNALLMLSQSYQAFPVVEKYAKAILQQVESIKDKDEYSDIKTLASAMAVKLRIQKDNWVDKPDKLQSTGHAPHAGHALSLDHRRGEVSKGDRTSSKTKTSLTTTGTPTGGSLKPDGGTKRSSDQEVSSEKRQRRDDEAVRDMREPDRRLKSDVVLIGDARDRDTKEVRDVKETRDRAEINASEKRREKDREREKVKSGEKEKTTTSKDPREAERKVRASTVVASTPRTVTSTTRTSDRPLHDERSEKRRRTEREPESGSHAGARVPGEASGDRGSGDRHGTSYGQQARNALTPPEGSRHYGGPAYDAYSRRGYPHSRHEKYRAR